VGSYALLLFYATLNPSLPAGNSGRLVVAVKYDQNSALTGKTTLSHYLQRVDHPHTHNSISTAHSKGTSPSQAISETFSKSMNPQLTAWKSTAKAFLRVLQLTQSDHPSL